MEYMNVNHIFSVKFKKRKGNAMKYHEINKDDNFYDDNDFINYELIKELFSEESESISEIIENWCMEEIGCH